MDSVNFGVPRSWTEWPTKRVGGSRTQSFIHFVSPPPPLPTFLTRGWVIRKFTILSEHKVFLFCFLQSAKALSPGPILVEMNGKFGTVSTQEMDVNVLWSQHNADEMYFHSSSHRIIYSKTRNIRVLPEYIPRALSFVPSCHWSSCVIFLFHIREMGRSPIVYCWHSESHARRDDVFSIKRELMKSAAAAIFIQFLSLFPFLCTWKWMKESVLCTIDSRGCCRVISSSPDVFDLFFFYTTFIHMCILFVIYLVLRLREEVVVLPTNWAIIAYRLTVPKRKLFEEKMGSRVESICSISSVDI